MRRILLDENMPRRLATLINQFGGEATAFPNEWKQLPDGPMLDRAIAEGFEVLLTGDKNMQFQVPLANKRICVVVMASTDRKAAETQARHVLRLDARFVEGRYLLLDGFGRLKPSDA